MSKFLADDLLFTFPDIPLDISEDDTDQWITDMLNKAAKQRRGKEQGKGKEVKSEAKVGVKTSHVN